VRVAARAERGSLVVTVTDQGRGMNPPPEDGLKRLGPGLCLSAKLTHQLHIESDGKHGTTVVARFPLSAIAAASAE
jgi:anti-sigma regulatory factor (Ser/Thr protein kinase)